MYHSLWTIHLEELLSCLQFFISSFFFLIEVELICNSYISFRFTAQWFDTSVCSAQHKCNYHLLPYNTITTPLSIFPMLCLSFSWLIHSITGGLYLPLHFFCPTSLYPLFWQLCVCSLVHGSVSVSCLFLCFLFWIPHKGEIIWCLFSSIWFITIIPSRSIQVLTNGKIASFFMMKS